MIEQVIQVASSYWYLVLAPLGLFKYEGAMTTFDLSIMSAFFLFFCPVVLIPLLFFGVRAPYGKFASTNSNEGESAVSKWWRRISSKTDIVLNGRFAFAFQESFALSSFLYVLLTCEWNWQDNFWLNAQQVIATAMFIGHYIHRAFIFTLIRTHSMSDSTLSTMLMACFFCSCNGYLNAKGIWIYSGGYFGAINVIIMLLGMILYIIGFYINFQSDQILINLRKKNQTTDSEKKYFIPTGGLYKYVSTPNYFGESVEWFGYFMCIQNRFAFLFVILTLSNLLPRAVQTHQWYLNKFGDKYRSLNRKAFVPYLL
ncbi:predicted protein [Naegleria gruberi]|uniref:Predicted protein n=1 Tax=Naegleria gruberi TaxID=5762 RepID=D2VPQ9_NAEGR|nr:uncharacterized protein NAEGRDRAFT_70951 [Naegleria gruberi]EFC41171.1 predicted protein [Naegleria gruberi]|eukprot:XP_002673915.1 predicted protein [Naegleria gruberi strain NEG-M]